MILETIGLVIIGIILLLWVYHRIKCDRSEHERFEYYLKENPKWYWLVYVDALLGAIVLLGTIALIVFFIQMLIK